MAAGFHNTPFFRRIADAEIAGRANYAANGGMDPREEDIPYTLRSQREAFIEGHRKAWADADCEPKWNG